LPPLLNLAEAAPLLISPDSGTSLELVGGELRSVDGKERFPLQGAVPLLFPARLLPYAGAGLIDMPWARYDDALLQYALVNSIKQKHGNHNSDHDTGWYAQHLVAARQLVADATGLVLDIGCDSPSVSAGVFPSGTRYLGLDPLFADTSQFRLIGLAERLPVRSGSVDCAALLTSLDHVLDHHAALDEAWRVLRPGGRLYLASLVWSARAELYHDHVHFHHFREAELLAALHRFRVDRFERFPWKAGAHRTAVYMALSRLD
jgi:SAM-dependent methyltransferase